MKELKVICCVVSVLLINFIISEFVFVMNEYHHKEKLEIYVES